MADIPWNVGRGWTGRAGDAHGDAVRLKSELCVDDRIRIFYLRRRTGSRKRRIGTSISQLWHHNGQKSVGPDPRTSGLAAPRFAAVSRSVCLLFLTPA